MNLRLSLQRFFRPSEASPRSSSFSLEGDLLLSLEQVARHRGVSLRQAVADLLARELQSVEIERDTLEKWHSLTEREQQVAALICLQYRTAQIAARLQIAPETVRSHVSHLLGKMNVPSRAALRVLLADWDFSHCE